MFYTCQIIGVKSSEELQKYIAKDQLTENFGGTFQYDHQDWVKFRMVCLFIFIKCTNRSQAINIAQVHV